MPIVDGFPRPDWNAIAEIIHAGPEGTWEAGWEEWSMRWLVEIAGKLPDAYRVEESDNFLYKSYFYPDEGEFILSSGTFLNTGYGHFAFPFMEMFEAEATSAHEMTHACLKHLPIPLWLNEGFAVTMEDKICGSAPLRMENERFAEHASFWNAETIQEYWSGESFNRTDQGSDLSYELARFCLRALAHEYDVFAVFANTASFEDGGEAAAIKNFGGSLGGVIHQFFGDGDWSPNPELWV